MILSIKNLPYQHDCTEVKIEHRTHHDGETLMLAGFIAPFCVPGEPLEVHDSRILTRAEAEELFLSALGIIDTEAF